MPNPSQEPLASSRSPNQDVKAIDVLCTFKIIGVPKTSAHVLIQIKIPNPSEEPPESSKALDLALKDMDIL